mgnify:CR=1 FL=1
MMQFNEELGCYWPDEENVKDYAHAKSRIGAIDVAMRYVKGHDYCLQAGGWVGMWALYLAKLFATVDVFEPVKYLYDCAYKNSEPYRHVDVNWCALGPTEGTLELMVERAGCTSALPSNDPKALRRQCGKVTVPMRTIDSLNLQYCDAIFLDVERYELQVLAGATETLKKFSPVLSLEVLKGEDRRVGEWAAKNGYRLRDRSFNDWILTR